MRYSTVSDKKHSGTVYTPSNLASYVANELIHYHSDPFHSEILILDPAIGTGELIKALLPVLHSSISHSKIKVVGYEIDVLIASSTQQILSALFPAITFEIRAIDFIQDYLDRLSRSCLEQYDLIIANPPYVRAQVLGASLSQELSSQFSVSGRIDLYYAFILASKKLLKETGVASYITSNKFMTIKSGSDVRNYMLQNFKVHHITDFGDTKLFDAAILPCVITFSLGCTFNKDSVAFTSIYQSPKSCTSVQQNTSSIFDVIGKSGVYYTSNKCNYVIQQGTLQSTSFNVPWTLESKESRKWLSIVESNTWNTFSSIGKIRVGIKTTADKVFIRENWTGDLSDIELLRPLITHRNAGQIISKNHFLWNVLYTHTTVNGKKVAYDINQFPKSKEYLLQYYDQLSHRSYIQKSKRNWYEIWVPQNPESWAHRKIIFRDIAEHPQFWLDESGAIVNGDCYWIDIYSDVPEDIVYLALAIANSSFIEKYYDIKFNTKLYSGKRRFQTQYVEQFPLPYYNTPLAHKTIDVVKEIISSGDTVSVAHHKHELDTLVNQLFS